MMPNGAEIIEKLAKSDERKAVLLEELLETEAENVESVKRLQEKVRKYLETN